MPHRLSENNDTNNILFKALRFEVTGHGYRFLIVWLFLLVASINYQNTLGYAFSLLLLSLVLVSIIYTVRNLLGLRIQHGRPSPVFADQEIFFPLIITATDSKRHETIRFCWHGYHRITTTIETGQATKVEVPMPGQPRGLFLPGSILIYTEYPFGLFRVKTKIKVTSSCLVYAKPKNHPGTGFLTGLSGQQSPVATEQDFSGMRPYSPGDSLKHIAWKALARSNEPLTKIFADMSSENHILDWQSVSALPLEEKISALTDAIVFAESRGDSYGLKTPEIEIQASTGADHRHACLKALALIGHEI